MSKPEKERKDKPNREEPEIIYSGPSQEPSPNDIFKELDDYQKQMESDWESTKQQYQTKIDQIMDDFIKEKGASIEEGMKAAPPPPPPPPPPAPPPPTPPPPPKPKKKTPTPGPKVDQIMADMQKTIDEAREKTKQISYKPFHSPPIINVTWDWRQKVLKRFIYGMVILLLVGVAGTGVWHYFRTLPSVTKLPYTHTSTVFLNGEKLWISDWFRRSLYVHTYKRGLPLESVESLPNQFTTGFVLTDQNLISVDGFNHQLILHTRTEDHRVLEKIDAPGKAPAGLVYDGDHVWIADNVNQTLYKLHAKELTDVLKEYAFSGVTVTSFQLINKRVWILDGTSREIHLFRLQNPLKKIRFFDLDPFLNGGVPTGLFVMDKEILVVTEKPAQLVRISKRKLKRVDPYEF